ncbi:MAG: hypothetical protein WCB27_11235 [Thermoguttaceae bacterium]
MMIHEIGSFASWRLGARILQRRGVPIMFPVAFRAIVFLLCMAASVVAWGEDRVQAELDRVAKMSGAEQQAWLRQLEQRAARATLAPKEAARQVAHNYSLLHRKTVTWKVLREVIEDTETREKAVAVAKTRAAKKTDAAKPQAANVAKPQAAKIAGKDPAAAVTVNVEELEASIAAANLALRELEADLAEKTAWTAAKLEPLADRLKTLIVRRDDLGLFRDAVPKDQQAEITKLETPKMAISQLNARLAEARRRASDPHFVSDEVERRAELTRLEAIAHRLAELAGK